MTNIYSGLIGRSKFPASSMRAKYFPLEGGENLTDPALSIPPGNLIFGRNYEVDPEGGYHRIDGFERYDGRIPKPSESKYYILDFQTGTTDMTDTTVITGATSGATAELVADAVVESGSFAGNDAVGYLVIALVTGTFQVGENIQVSASTTSVVQALANVSGATTDALDSTYAQAAEERARSKIGIVPGSGNMRGVWSYGGTIYAFRDNAGGTECKMYKSTTSGWTAVDLGQYIKYNLGLVEVAEGATLTGATSGATGTVRRVITMTGNVGTSNALGYFCFIWG